MLDVTIDLLKAGLKSDPTITPSKRAEVLALIKRRFEPMESKTTETMPVRILRRKVTAERLSLSLRSVDKLAQQGILPKVTLPGRKRAAGFREEDVIKLMV